MKLPKCVTKNSLLLSTILAVSIGICLGLFVRRFSIPPKSALLRVINFPGEIFLRGIKLLIIPLISSSLIVGIAGNTVIKSGPIARRTMFFFFITTLQAVVLGVVLAVVIRPGKLLRTLTDENYNSSFKNSSIKSSSAVLKLSSLDMFMDVIRNLIPDNLIEMCFQIYRSSIQTLHRK